MNHGSYRATVNPSKPEAFAICDVCGSLWSHDRLRFQYDWSGTELINKHLLVCPHCYDKPFVPGKTILLPPDPVPIENPRPNAWAEQSGETNPSIPNPWPD